MSYLIDHCPDNVLARAREVLLEDRVAFRRRICLESSVLVREVMRNLVIGDLDKIDLTRDAHDDDRPGRL